jgi:hypothetical protein
MIKYRFKFIVETKEDPDIIFRKIWDALKMFDEDHFGMYNIIHSNASMVKILAGVYALGGWDNLTQEVLTTEIKKHVKEYIKEKKR